jgi:opacity protein-like surface antigen
MGTKFLVVLLWGGVCLAQEWEIGGAIGYGIYRDVRVNAPGAQAEVGIRNRFAAGAVVTENLYDHFSGEVRYTYQDGDPFLSFNGVSANVQGQSHAIAYDVLVHVRSRDERLRPFGLVGVGGKYYRTTGPAPEVQPAPNVAFLNHANEWKVLVSVGGGVTYRVHKHVILRAEFRDDITPFPKRLFVPVTGGTDRGLFQQFTPMVTVAYGF